MAKSKYLLIVGLSLIAVVVVVIVFSVVSLWPYTNDNSEEIVQEYIKALLLKNNDYIQKVSKYQISEFSWLNKVIKEAKYYSDTGFSYTEYWIWFKFCISILL